MNQSDIDPLSRTVNLTESVNISDPLSPKERTNSDPFVDLLGQSTPTLTASTTNNNSSQNTGFVDPLSRPMDYNLSQSMNLVRISKEKDFQSKPLNLFTQPNTMTTTNPSSTKGLAPPREIKKENLKGIYAFFGSTELPPNPKIISQNDIPHGLDAIPFIFQTKCYAQGADLMSQFIVE